MVPQLCEASFDSTITAHPSPAKCPVFCVLMYMTYMGVTFTFTPGMMADLDDTREQCYLRE